jgi:hypothetical protein
VSEVSVLLLLHCWTGRLFGFWLGYSMLHYLMETFAPMRMVKVRNTDDMSGIRNWLDENVERAIKESDESYNMLHDNVNRVRGYRLWLGYVEKRRLAENCTIICVFLVWLTNLKDLALTLM